MDPRKTLTEEVPETPKDFQSRNLTEFGGETRVSTTPRVLTEVPDDDLDEEEEEEQAALNSNLLLG